MRLMVLFLDEKSDASRRQKWRVGKLAHDPLRSRCPRAAPNPFLRDYAPALQASMGHQSHATGYEGSSTARPSIAKNQTSIIP